MHRVPLLIFIVSLLCISNCRENIVQVKSVQDATGSVLLKLDAAPQEITRVTATLGRHGFSDLTISLVIGDSLSGASGVFENVAVGTWHLKVDALDDSDIVRFTGEKDIEVFAGDTTHTDLELLASSGIVEVHVHWGHGSLNSRLMLHMPFDGTLTDSSGNGNDGSCANPLYTSDRFGNAQRAYKFNGVDNFITVANSSSLNPSQALTIAFWFKIDTVAWNVSQLISKTIDDVESQREYVVELKANYDYPYFKLWAAPPTGYGLDELDAGAALVHQWHHFAGIVDRKDSHSMKMYIDGVLDKELADYSDSFLSNTHTLFIGAGEGSWEHQSVPNMTMDDLRIYSRALSSADIQALYQLH